MDTHERKGEGGYAIRKQHKLGKKMAPPTPEKMENRRGFKEIIKGKK